MAESVKKLTRKEKIAAGVEKKPKRKKAMAERMKSERQERGDAQLRNHTIAPRKMRLVVDLVRGMEVDKALNVLKFTPKAGALPLRKLLLSAISNWEAKNEGQRASEGGLVVKIGYVNAGRVLKRFQPAPQGRAHRIRKRSHHVTLILGTKEIQA
jgi:large subunit ribosomal protein L22